MRREFAGMRASRVLGCGVSQLCVGFGILLQTRGTADSERDGGLVHFKWQIEYGFGVFGGDVWGFRAPGSYFRL